ncbi:MAG TPA: 2-dehydropantoate 2-reductase [Candidatus Elarobacter sp.]|nr:2-dehydropantoate 2-reductase [Candidatus Elarobacter sp.]
MRICIIGAGAIGGMLGARLALAGESVTFVEKNREHADAIRTRGLRVEQDGAEIVAEGIAVTGDLREPGPQDLVIIAVKAHQIPSLMPDFRALLGPETIVMTVQNGVPWWYFFKAGGPHDGRRIEAVDPSGIIDESIERERIIGCIVYPAGEVVAPGVVHVVEGNRFSVGELDGAHSERVEALAAMLVRAGFKSFVLDDIRAEIWLKLWGNLSFNPISALTHQTLAGMCRNPHTRALAAAMMAEAQQIGEKLGITFRHTIEKRLAGAEAVGEHKTSMLQDVEAGRAPEIEALVGAVVELGRLTETPTPHIDSIYAAVKGLEETLARRPVPVPA